MSALLSPASDHSSDYYSGHSVPDNAAQPGCQPILAQQEHLSALWQLIGDLQRQGCLRQRSRQQVAKILPDFLLIGSSDKILACSALHCSDDLQSGEIACVATVPQNRRCGYATVLVNLLEQRARNYGLKWLFAHTATAVDWFLLRGYRHAQGSHIQFSKSFNQRRQSGFLLSKKII